MSTIRITYDKDLRTNCKQANGTLMTMDGPKEAGGKEEFLSPTDLLAAALATCTLTMLGYQAKQANINIEGATATVEKKEMTSTNPKRIAKLAIKINIPANPSADIKKKLEDAALHCPVHLSLHPDITQDINFSWNTPSA